MATRFEFVLHGTNRAGLRAAAEEALDEVERIENQLSLFRPHTDVARINAGAALGSVRIAPEVFRLVERAVHLSKATEGAFDITAGAWMRAWGFHVPENPGVPTPVVAVSGASLLELNSAAFTVRFTRPGMRLDLGAVGKGYALDRAAELLREAGVHSALLHGGTSSIVAMGVPPDAVAWKVALPAGEAVELREESLSVSATWGRTLDVGGLRRGHVIDPRTGEPVPGPRMAAVACPLAADSDALSTALLVLGAGGRETILRASPQARVWFSNAGEGDDA
jgi:thiamine biosynthesis lipoprotein